MTGLPRTAVAIGLGNPLLGDDGVGLRVIEALDALGDAGSGQLPPGTRLVAAGAPSLDLLGLVADARTVVLIDATDRGAPPGSVSVSRGDAVLQRAGRGDVGELLLAARLTGHAPAAVAIVEIQVGSLATGTGLSNPVEAAVPAAVAAACHELARLTTETSRPGPLPAEMPAWPAGGVCA